MRLLLVVLLVLGALVFYGCLWMISPWVAGAAFGAGLVTTALFADDGKGP